ncbi:LysR family transcriptional regulator [Enterobacterales bacterium BD_CKDN230030183-1A_HGKHYDSX7]
MDRALEMKVFCTVVDRGSFVAASEVLCVSNGAVSRRISMLEERLGVRLLHRTTRRLALTEEGRLFYQQARDVLSRIDEAESSVSQGAGEPLGTLRINAPFSFGILHLASRWARFLERYPKIELDINLNDRQVDLIEEGYDVAIRVARLQDSSLIGRKIASTRMRLCAAPSYLEKCPSLNEPGDLMSHPVIAYTNFAMGNDWRYVGPDGEGVISTRPVVRSNNGDTCRSIALAGGGILLHPSFMIGQDIEEGRLIEIFPDLKFVELGIYIVYPTPKYLPPKVQALIHFLSSEFKGVSWD